VDPQHVHFVEIQGRRVRYLDQGSGHPLLLCHGFMGSLENFHTWSPAFAGHRRVLIPDLPGCGETPVGEEAHSIAAYAGFLNDFAQQLGLSEHDVGGICLGATVALDYSSRFMDRVTRLVLHTPVYSPRSIRPGFLWQSRLLTSPLTFRLLARARQSRRISDLYKRFLTEGEGVDPYDAQVNFDNQCRADANACREWLIDAVRRDYEGFLRGWKRPALIVVAADDRIVRIEAIRQLAGMMPQAELRVIEAAGHGWTPALIKAQVQVITSFLARS
jgi:pimeloyl-ACP methyl ester carboxylesterase